ncbi:MAG: LPS export ABC transporter permease LptF [Hyphomicrobiaceae bacterium]
MKLISRYVFRQTASALTLILGSLGGIVWIALALKQLDVVTSKGQDALMLIKITSLALPNLLAVVAPFALLIATMHVLNRLGSDSELIVLTASGSPAWSLARPLLALALMVTLAVGLVNNFVQPWSLQKLKAYIVEMRADLLTKVIQPGRFSSPEQGLTFHIRARDTNGDLLGLMVSDRRKDGEDRIYLSEKAQIAKQDDAAYLVLSDGHILRARSGEPSQVIRFDSYVVDLDEFDKQSSVGPVDQKPRARYFSELVNPEPGSNNYRRYAGQFRAELHERFANPLYPLAFVLIALAAVGQAQSTRENRAERLAMGFIIAVGVRVAGFAVNTLVVKSALFVPLLYALPLGAILGALISLKRGARPQSRISLVDTVSNHLAPLIERLPFGRRRAMLARGAD